MTATHTRNKLRQELVETRTAYHALVAEIPESLWDRPTANPAWNIGTLLFHITIALKFFPGDLKMLRNGRFITPPKKLFDKLNEWYTSWAARKHNPQSLLIEYNKVHTRVMHLLDDIKEDEWQLSGIYPDINENLAGEQTIENMFHYLTRHFWEHEAEIRAALTNQNTIHEEQIMPKQIGTPTLPTGIGRLFFRAPIKLYKAGLGWTLGRRFLLLNHIGRKSKLPRQAVLEVVGYEADTDTYLIASGWGKQAQWYKNIMAQPENTIVAGRRKLAVTAVPFSPEESGEQMVQYAKRNPIAAKNLARLIGFTVDGSEDDFRAIGRDVVPFIALQPKQLLSKSEGLPAWPFLVGLAAIITGIFLKKRKSNAENK
ncbi:MAG: nitroreductase family deazaflavin-dependent oxidoreductase [Chloroflexi bacterium]|nr:nitroreductase family deazaflavin-dependent oxidoreductase [Chloroflexota bacterium]